ncbi:hypothetical protein [Imhoffiella purpurea]|uniref:Transmembrane protein n=1 Tax=Imhoffiella purpurea TaxID=1249627 RepID=W9V6K2_9GAMM|nr:hypothetical protein [Imhoffiella purpurea]EXJ15193.1 hypothetical protein D779_1491 [Imhoffiella purpurea]
MLEFSIALALYDFVPVFLTGAALWYLSRFVGLQLPERRLMALTGGALVFAGGLSKASWKLIAASTGTDLAWLAAALFPLMAPGFALLAVSVWASSRNLRGHVAIGGWRLAVSSILVAFLVAALRQWLWEIPRGWFLPLLVLASLGNLILSAQLIWASLHLRRWMIALLFGVNLGMIFALQPIAMAVPKTMAMHWIEQTLTAVGTGCFALAVYLLWRASERRRSLPSLPC